MPPVFRSPMLLAGLLAGPAHRRAGHGGLLRGVFPANVRMAADWRCRPAPLRAAALGRLPLQVPLVLWARNMAGQAESRRG
ncbi:hypothetical protein OG302_35990 [Streptomyces sp. NBC_01283]|nr:hypothetical protein OG302_35990 [Streptomyces sp. NBC_01283]